MSKQDRQGARTVTDLERKYNLKDYGEQFAVVMGIATDARNATEELEEKLESEIAAVRNEIAQGAEGILLRSEFEQYQQTVTAELALKVAKTDSEQIISMLEAYADEIRLQSNTLIISSDYFSLLRNGEAFITNANIDLATITNAYIADANILRGEITDAKITRGSIEDATIKRGSIEDVTIKNANIEYDDVETANISKARIRESYIGNVYFGEFTGTTQTQASFESDGIFLNEHSSKVSSRDCFVWQNNDGNNTLRLRVLDGKMYLESLTADGWVSKTTDLIVGGVSFRDMYDLIQNLPSGGLGETLTLVYDEATCAFSWNSITGATEYDVFIDGADYETTDKLSYAISYDTFVAMFGEGEHPVYVVAKNAEGNELATSETITIIIESCEHNGVYYDSTTQTFVCPECDERFANNGDWGGSIKIENFVLSGDKLTWKYMVGANIYTLYVDGKENESTTLNSFDLSTLNLSAGEHTLQIKAYPNMSSDKVIAISDSVTYTAAFTIWIEDGVWLEWEPYPNATSYMLYIDGNPHPETVTTDSAYLPALGLAEGTYSISVTALNSAGIGLMTSNAMSYIVASNCDHDITQESVDDPFVCSKCGAEFTTNGEWGGYYMFAFYKDNGWSKRVSWTNLYGLTAAGSVSSYWVTIYRDNIIIFSENIDAYGFTGNAYLDVADYVGISGTYKVDIEAWLDNNTVVGTTTTTFTV